MSPPPLRFPDAVRADLDAHRPGLAHETEEAMAAHARPCVAVRARRVGERPLRRNPLGRLFGARPAVPVLGVRESKFGGAPYSEAGESWDGHSFLGQIDLARATAVLPAGGPCLHGLLRMGFTRPGRGPDFGFRVRWFPEPRAEAAVAAPARSVGRWETRLEFSLEWTLPEGNALEKLWPLREPRWYDYERFYPQGYNGDGFDEFHRMLGHMSSGLDDSCYGFAPPPGCPADLCAYEQLLRLTFDNAAGFGWGTNWVYLLVPRDDLARGDLSRLVVTGANS